MLAYYLDEPLSELEQNIVIEQINAISSYQVTQLKLKPITGPMPANDTNLTHAEIVVAFEDLLIKSGIPTGTQSTFILPKGGLSWGMLLQIAFKNISKHYPFVVQPWEMNKDRNYQRRKNILVTDINSAMPV